MTTKKLDIFLTVASAGMLLYDLAKRANAGVSRETSYIEPGFNAQDVFGGYDLFKSQSKKKKNVLDRGQRAIIDNKKIIDFYVETYNLDRDKKDLVNIIVDAADRYGVYPPLMLSLAKHESSFNPNAVGITGDVGLFQLNPRYYNRNDAFNAVKAADIATRAIKDYEERFRVAGNKHLTRINAVMAYNWGPTRLDRVIGSSKSKGINVKYGVPSKVASYAYRVVRDAERFNKWDV